MSEELDDRAPQERSCIHVHETCDVDYWTHTLGVSEAKLIDAVMAVGTSADEVRRYLAKQATR